MKSAKFLLLNVLNLFLLMMVFMNLVEAQLPATLTVQETLYPGAPTAGEDRVQEPVTVGLPVADADGISDISQLGLQGASVGQFRVLGRWPSGNIQWVLVDTQADLTAGRNNTAISMTSGGTGNFGGPNLANDNGDTVKVDTGAAVFTIRKANFNIFDQVRIGEKTLISRGS